MENFHFVTSYEIAVDPEFPGNGEWDCPVFGFDCEGRVGDEFRSTWGTPLVVEVTTGQGARWVGMFEASGLGGVRGVFATPGSARACVVVDGLAYLVDVDNPDAGVTPVKWQVHQVTAVDNEAVLLLVRMIDLTAIGPDGILWDSPRLALDDLMVESAVGGEITCSLDNLGGTPTITLDAQTGMQLSGSQLSWPSGSE